MASELDLKPSGLYSDSASPTAPNGALRQADDVVMRRPGVIEPRPAIQTATGYPDLNGNFKDRFITGVFNTSTPLGRIKSLTVTGGTVVVAATPLSTTTATTVSEYVAISGYRNRSAEARNNFYFTARGKAWKMESSSSAPKVAGMPQGEAPQVGTNTPGNGTQNVRSVFYRKDANGYLVYGPPSPQAKTATGSAIVRQWLPDNVATGDYFQLYRGRSGVDDDRLFLIKEVEIQASHISAGVVSVGLFITDSGGAEIYTSPQQETIIQRNDAPPGAADMALYQDSMFYANVRAFETFVTLENGNGTIATNPRPGFFQAATNTWHFTSGTAIATADVGNAAQLQVGMLVSSTRLAAATVISTVYNSGVKDYIRFGANANSTGTASPRFYDFFTVGDETVFPFYQPDTIVSRYGGTYEGQLMQYISHAIDVGMTKYRSEVLYQANASAIDSATLRVYSVSAAGSAAVSFSPKGRVLGATRDGLAGNTAWSGIFTLRQTGAQNALVWSKPNLPEAVPTVNSVLVGAENYPILRIIPTRDALYIFKQDGIWVLTGPQGGGSFPPAWRVDLLDPTLSLLTPDCVDVIGDTIYGWFSRGVHSVQRGGIRDLGFGRVDDQVATIQNALSQRADRSKVDGVFLAASEGDREVYLGVPATVSSGSCTNILVYNTETDSWVRWKVSGTVGAEQFRRLGGITFNQANKIQWQKQTANARAPDPAVSSVVEFRGKSARNPAMKKRWIDCHWLFDNADDATSVELSMTSSESGTAVTATETFSARTSDGSRSVRFRVPRNHSRATEVYPKVSLLGGDWSISGASLTYQQTSKRTTR